MKKIVMRLEYAVQDDDIYAANLIHEALTRMELPSGVESVFIYRDILQEDQINDLSL